MLGEREDRGIPAVRVQARRVVDRQPEIVADLRTGDPFGLILVKARRPLTGEVVPGWGCRRLPGVERQDRQQRERPDEHREAPHTPPETLFMMTLTSVGLIKSGTVHPFKSYSAMHASAKPL